MAGAIRRITFEAADEADARGVATHCNAGLEGETAKQHIPVPEAYDSETARGLLGGISESTLYRRLVTGKLERVPGETRVLVTRRSIEQWGRPKG